MGPRGDTYDVMLLRVEVCYPLLQLGLGEHEVRLEILEAARLVAEPREVLLQQREQPVRRI